MAGKSPVEATEEQRGALRALAHSRDRGEADLPWAILLTLASWTSQRIAQAFGVREDTVACGAATSPAAAPKPRRRLSHPARSP
jgi:hypothetical protein